MRLLALAALFTSSVFAGQQTFSSGPHRVHLLELFTSEGCSSCPPAEAWLTQRAEAAGLWRSFVPIAWHVNYWDHLGWKDRYASRAATDREYAYARTWDAPNVYTPCFVLDGAEWRPGTGPDATESAPELRATYAARRVKVTFKGTDAGGYRVHAVLLRSAIASAVRAGENGGRTLRHDFVAATPPVSAALEAGSATLALPSPVPGTAPGHLALAVWVTRPANPTPLQATGGPLPDEP